MMSVVATSNSLLEAAWVLAVHGTRSLLIGSCVAITLVGLESRLPHRTARLVGLGTAVMTLWIAIFLGVDGGYRTWQATPGAPEEAYSDTGGPFAAMFLGWAPALAMLWPLHRWLVRSRQERR